MGASARSFSDAQLAELAMSPRDLVASRLERGDAEGAVAVLARLDLELAGQMRRYRHWLAALFEFAGDRHGEPGRIRLLDATRAALVDHPDALLAEGADPDGFGPTMAGRVADGDVPGSLAVFDDLDARWRRHVDLHRDWISALLTAVYRCGGADELEAAHRAVGKATMDGLLADIGSPSPERLERFVWLLKAHFSELTLEELDDRYLIHQRPCGTCGRQARDGRHRPPLDLAVVDERHAVTWGRGATTAYRTHVPIWHVLMAGERIGVPWPVNLCPSGADESDCTIVLFKDPLDPAALDLVPGAIDAFR
jgi:hypothetical protein